MEEGATSQEIRWSLEARKSKREDCPPESPEGIEPCWHLDFSPDRLILDLGHSEL